MKEVSICVDLLSCDHLRVDALHDNFISVRLLLLLLLTCGDSQSEVLLEVVLDDGADDAGLRLGGEKSCGDAIEEYRLNCYADVDDIVVIRGVRDFFFQTCLRELQRDVRGGG